MSQAKENSMDSKLSIKSWAQEDYIIKIGHQEQKSLKATNSKKKVSESEQGMRFLQQNILSETLKLDKAGNPIDLASKQIVDDNNVNTGMVTFHLLPYVQLPFLQSLYNKTMNGNTPKVIEIGASEGRLTSKMLLTGAKVVANDLYDNQLKLAKDFVNHKLQFRAKDFSTTKASVFDILKVNPEYKSHFDYVYIQNLIHFFNPHQCLELFKTTWDLLNANGIAYITAQTYFARAQQSIKGASYSISGNEIDRKHNEESAILGAEKILSYILTNINQEKEFPSFLEIRNDKSGKLKFVKDADHNAKVGRTDSNGGVYHPMAEETLKFLAKNQGFIVKEIFCGNNIGDITPCFNEAYASNKPMQDAYITIVIQKEDHQEVNSRISDQELEFYNQIIEKALQYEHYVEETFNHNQ